MRSLNLITNIKNRKNGFTVIELVMVIVIIGILTSISIISYGNWKQQTVITQIKSDLNMAASAMKDARTFGSVGYPEDINNVESYKAGASGDVVISGGGSPDGKTFCLNATTTSYPSLLYHIDSTHTANESESGECLSYIKNISIPSNSNVGVQLSATLLPSGATASYQWQSADSPSYSNFTDITNATLPTYTPTLAYEGKKIRVKATGTGEYTGVATSNSTAVVQPAPISLISISLSGTSAVGSVLTSSLNPTSPPSTVTYQWKSSTTLNGNYDDILGANTSSYAIPASQSGKYLRISAIGNGNYTGTVSATTLVAVIIPTPVAPTVTASTPGATTTWSWNGGINCVAGTTARYRYDYFIDGVSQAPSGWKTPTVDTATSISFTTSTENRTYKVTVSGQCYYGTNVSAWGASGEFSYLRPITTYTLSTSVSGYGSGSITGAGTYNAGTTVTLTATPAAGAIFGGGLEKTIFVSWSGACSGETTCSVVMNSNKSVTGNFDAFYPVWRMTKSSTYFYTIWDSEKEIFSTNGWAYEGAAFGAFQYQAINTLPVYRLLKSGMYLYTIDVTEKNACVAAGWTNEGVAFYAYTSLTPIRADVVRTRNGTTGKYLWTTSHPEMDALPKPPWVIEGVAFYGFY